MHNTQKGFTLLELMIVVAVIALLAAIALPMYTEQVRKGKRAEAMQALGDIQLRQERWRADHPRYGALNDVTGGTTYNSSLKNYDVSVTLPATAVSQGLAYTLTATRKGDLANDPKCGNFILRMSAGVITKDMSSGDVAYCWRQ